MHSLKFVQIVLFAGLIGVSANEALTDMTVAEYLADCTDQALGRSLELLASDLVKAADRNELQDVSLRQRAERVSAHISRCSEELRSGEGLPATGLRARKSTTEAQPSTSEASESQSSVTSAEEEAERREESITGTHLAPDTREIHSRAIRQRRMSVLEVALQRTRELEQLLPGTDFRPVEAYRIASDLNENAKELLSMK